MVGKKNQNKTKSKLSSNYPSTKSTLISGNDKNGGDGDGAISFSSKSNLSTRTITTTYSNKYQQQRQQKQKIIKNVITDNDNEESTSSDSTEYLSSTDEEERWKDVGKPTELSSDYWNITKLIKYIKAGNQTATVVSLCCLKDYDLTLHINQLAIQNSGGLEILVNLLECNDMKCRLGALTVLADISLNFDIRKTIVDLGAIPLLIDILNSTTRNLRKMAAETLSNVGKVRLARKYVRKCGGIPKLVDLLDIPEK